MGESEVCEKIKNVVRFANGLRQIITLFFEHTNV